MNALVQLMNEEVGACTTKTAFLDGDRLQIWL